MERFVTCAMLKRALAGLSSESFTHPIWRHYLNNQYYPSLESIQGLVRSAEELHYTNEAHDACQILLLGAVLHSRRNDPTAALQLAQQAWEWAESDQLSRASNWCAWGLCALNVNQGEFQKAVSLLKWLQIKLQQEGEWILSNHLELIRLALSRGAQPDSYYEIILEMFASWGEPTQPLESINRGISPENDLSGGRQPLGTPQEPSGSGIRKGIKGLVRLPTLVNWLQRRKRSVARYNWVDGQNKPLPPANSLPVKRCVGSVKPKLQKSSVANGGLVDPLNIADGLTLARPVLTIQLLGNFRAAINDRPLSEFPHGRVRGVFKYLAYHHGRRTPREVLMDLFWPEVDPESARNSLNVTFYNIRKALRSVTSLPIIIFEDGAYGLNLEIDTWIDVEEFTANTQLAHKLELEGEINKAKVKLEIAANLYQGDFMAEDPYEEWTNYPRQRLRAQYLDVLYRLSRIYYHQGQYTACAALCHLIIKYDSCDEEAHRRLIRCYGRQNQYHLAIRQYRTCADSLQNELGVKPAEKTVKLYERARRREHTKPLKLYLK